MNGMTPKQAREQMQLAEKNFGRNSPQYLEKEKEFYELTINNLESDPQWEEFNMTNPNPLLLRFLERMKEKHGLR